ncbi:MAG: 23S rRNA (adenine(2503)-C(2))-methyltransferase RlmN [Synergistaceae bacterium]|jgi:23S rRNA (adenine2503-C2)-methyltransferase|nr:23S rRNA (adenine(2503)-C(2))-methyltransferase RlmN [Synergistaceae bacterium]
MEKTVDAFSMTLEQWQDMAVGVWKEPRFRADQVCSWIYGKKVFDPSLMSNLPKTLRERMCGLIRPPAQITETVSRDREARKYLWEMADGKRVESVLLDHGEHTTACVSTQVGCPLACAFCATGQSGYERDLTAGEIVAQFIAVEHRLNKDVNNLVFMGMGEPLLNEANLFKSIRILSGVGTRGLGARHITVSTAGIADGIRDLADFEVPVRLSVSLHAPNDALRNRLMPLNRRIPLATLVDSMRHYKKRTGERITIEYVLIEKVNDDPQLAFEMAALLDGLGVYVNLIPYNTSAAAPSGAAGAFRRPSDGRIKAFCAALSELSIEFEIRRSKGADIAAACGQLKSRNS